MEPKNILKLVQEKMKLDDEKAIETCKRLRVCKPHLDTALALIKDENTITSELTSDDIRALLILDKGFYELHLAKDFDIHKVYEEIHERSKFEWYVRIPDWLETSDIVQLADNEYRSQTIMNVRVPFFTVEDVPSYFSVLQHIKPSTDLTHDVATYFGPIKMITRLKPALDADAVRALFTVVVGITDKVSGKRVSELQVTTHKDFIDFIADGTPPTDLRIAREMAVIATSVTPYNATLLFIVRHGNNVASFPPGVLSFFNASVTLLDGRYGGVLTSGGVKPLTNIQVINVIKKTIDKFESGKGLVAKEIFYNDYEFWEALRFTSKPLESAAKFQREVNYFETYKARFKSPTK